MNVVFYFARAVVTFQQLTQVASEFEYRSSQMDIGGVDSLRIYYKLDDAYWEWMPLREDQGDFDSFEPANQARIVAYKPASVYIVLHRPLSWPTLRTFLHRVLSEYAGWVGSDTQDLQPVFTVDNIETLPNPLYVETLEYSHRTKTHPPE